MLWFVCPLVSELMSVMVCVSACFRVDVCYGLCLLVSELMYVVCVSACFRVDVCCLCVCLFQS